MKRPYFMKLELLGPELMVQVKRRSQKLFKVTYRLKHGEQSEPTTVYLSAAHEQHARAKVAERYRHGSSLLAITNVACVLVSADDN